MHFYLNEIINYISFDPIIDYIDSQYESYLRAERSQEMRRNIQDNRVHCVLYFLPPTGKG